MPKDSGNHFLFTARKDEECVWRFLFVNQQTLAASVSNTIAFNFTSVPYKRCAPDGTEEIHQLINTQNVTWRLVWQVYPWVAPAYNFHRRQSEFSQLKTQWASWLISHLPKQEPQDLFPMLSLTCYDTAHVTSLLCASIPTLQVEKTVIYHWNLNANREALYSSTCPKT